MPKESMERIAAFTVTIGGFLAVGGATLPWASAPLDYGREAFAVLLLGIALMAVGVGLGVRSSSRALALVGLLIGATILALAVPDAVDAAQKGGTILSGMYVAILGGLCGVVGPVLSLSTGRLRGQPR